MEYRILLLSNGKFKKTLHVSKQAKTAYLNYHKLLRENNVLFPKKYVNSNAIKPVSYEICIVKEPEETDEFRTLRDKFGKLYEEKPLNGMTVLVSEEYFIEETFYIYGYEGDDRPNIREVVKRLMTNAYAKNVVKQIIVVYNKLIIYNDDQFEMIICKNRMDCLRLHHTLGKIAKKQKIKSLMFMGKASPATLGRMYQMIEVETGWSRIKIRRTTTRP